MEDIKLFLEKSPQVNILFKNIYLSDKNELIKQKSKIIGKIHILVNSPFDYDKLKQYSKSRISELDAWYVRLQKNVFYIIHIYSKSPTIRNLIFKLPLPNSANPVNIKVNLSTKNMAMVFEEQS